MKSAVVIALASSLGVYAAPHIVEVRQIFTGGLEGSVPDASGFLTGVAGLSPFPFATGEIGGAATAPAFLEAREAEPQNVAGGLSGFVPNASGFLTGIAGLQPTPYATGEAGGAATDPAAPAPTSDIGGYVGGTVSSGPGGFVSGFIGSGTIAGCIGGALGDVPGVTLCAREAEATPAPELAAAL